MQIYWTHKSIPELRDLKPRQRRKVWRACWLRPYRHWQTWVAFVGQFLVVLVGGLIGMVIDGDTWILGGHSPTDLEKFTFPWGAVLLMNLGAVMSGCAFWQFHLRLMRPELKRYLESHGHA